MNLTLSTCFVLVHDPDVALAFYRDTLGLELRNDVARGDFRWITVGAGAQPDVGIVLTNYLNGSPADGDAVAALVAKGALNGVHFHTDDLDGTFEQLKASSTEIVQEPTEQPGGRATAPCATPPATWCASTSRRPARQRHGPRRRTAAAAGARKQRPRASASGSEGLEQLDEPLAAVASTAGGCARCRDGASPAARGPASWP